MELPEVGRELKAGDIFAAVESVKAVSDCYTPVSGTVIEINEKLLDAPEIINEDPHGQGWICVIEIADEKELDELMDNAAYESFIKEGGN